MSHPAAITQTRDAALLAHIHRDSFPPTEAWSEASFSSSLAMPGVQAWLLEDSGFLLTRRVAEEMEVLTLATRPACRRQGIARGLMIHALDTAGAQGMTRCFLEVATSNIAAIRCYESLAFTTVTTRKQYYRKPDGTAQDALLMQWSLR